jgi:hypothetical protein
MHRRRADYPIINGRPAELLALGLAKPQNPKKIQTKEGNKNA